MDRELDAGPAFLLRGHHPRDDPLEQDGLTPEVRIRLAEPVQRDDVLDEALEPLRFLRDVVEDLAARRLVERCPRAQRPRATVDRRDRRPELVREDPDEGLADRLALPLLGDVAKDQDRLATRVAVGRSVGTG